MKPVVTDGKIVLQICSLVTVQILYVMCSQTPLRVAGRWMHFCLPLSGALWMRQDGADGEDSGSRCEQLGWPFVGCTQTSCDAGNC